MTTSPPDATNDDPRKGAILDAALLVFLRFGFRKTSMDEVARAAHISRQGLYLHFNTKEALFVATVSHSLRGSMAQALLHLAAQELTLERRLLNAFDEVVGRFVGVMRADASDLAEAGNQLVGNLLAEHEASFIAAVAKCLRSAGLAQCYKPLGIGALKLADALFQSARGLKYSAADRADFLERFEVAVRIFCFPLCESP